MGALTSAGAITDSAVADGGEAAPEGVEAVVDKGVSGIHMVLCSYGPWDRNGHDNSTMVFFAVLLLLGPQSLFLRYYLQEGRW